MNQMWGAADILSEKTQRELSTLVHTTLQVVSLNAVPDSMSIIALSGQTQGSKPPE